MAWLGKQHPCWDLPWLIPVFNICRASLGCCWIAVPRIAKSAKVMLQQGFGMPRGAGSWALLLGGCFGAKDMECCPSYTAAAGLIPEAALPHLCGFGIEVSGAFGYL